MSIVKSSLWFSLGTLLSRVSGLIREAVMAGVFGASSLLDAFFIANRIPNMLRDIAAEGALGASFTKIFSEEWEKNPEKAKKFLKDSIAFYGLCLFILCVFGIMFSPFLVKALTLFQHENRSEEFYKHCVGLTRLLFPFIAAMSLAAIFAGALHQKGRFLISSLTPIALNFGYILGAIFLARVLEDFDFKWLENYIAPSNITGLSLGVLLGGCLQCFVLFWLVKKSFFEQSSFFPLRLRWTPKIKETLFLMGPMVIASSSAQINIIINTNFATSLEAGTVSWLSYSFRLLQLPIGIFAVAIGSAALPALTKTITSTRSIHHPKVSQQLEDSIVLSLWLLVPCLCFLLINCETLVNFLFYHGNFDERSARATSQALYYYSFGVLGYGLIKVVSSFYYAAGDTKFPMKVSLTVIFINFTANYFLVDQYGFKGLALSSSIVFSINALILLYGLKRYSLPFNYKRLTKSLTYILFAVFAGFIVLGILKHYFQVYCDHLPNKIFSFLDLIFQGIFLLIIFVMLYCLEQKKSLKQIIGKFTKR
tara:strand:+ start:1345 stop:2955 length:1611 start_codon:yes stop_codon:yes gene_type:complete